MNRKRINLTLTKKQYEFIKNKADEEKEETVTGFAKRTLLKTLEVPSCQIA
ncbi:MAG: hypothetical protein KC646_06910 [Candidatus Cloacimonetes bacterium]|nr:hypothetical protein [Candidatus Cloacimonadota bacterium]